jgi:hypothetical protein
MKALATIALVLGGLVAAVGVAASESTTGARGTGYTVFCTDAVDDAPVALKIPSAASAPNRLHAVELFKQQHPGGRCFVLRPHHD